MLFVAMLVCMTREASRMATPMMAWCSGVFRGKSKSHLPTEPWYCDSLGDWGTWDCTTWPQSVALSKGANGDWVLCTLSEWRAM